MGDVAEKAGVSRTLVSLIFRNEPGAGPETRERVLRAADELGYRPDSAARLLARGRSRTIGVVVSMDQSFHAELVNEIYPEAERLGYDVLLSVSGPTRTEHRAVDALLSHRCEALIVLGPHADARFLRELGESAVVVAVGCRIAGVDSVHTADAKGMRQAVDHLVELGHRRILHIDGGKDPGSADRRRGYRNAMRRHGLDNEIQVLAGAHNENAGIVAGRTLLDEGQLPTAVLAGNDHCAMGLMHVLRRAGVEIPRDLSVVGYDDSRLSHLSHIDLTTVHQEADRMGQHAVRAAVHRLENPDDDAQDIVVDPKLVVRGTSGPPPQ